MNREDVYNFGAGPTMMPSDVLEEANREFMNYNNSGMSVMEINHRSVLFNEIVDEAKKDLTDLMSIPSNYKIMFLQGGASLQFAAIPMNLMKNRKAGYIITGHWAKRALEEAQMYGEAITLATSEDSNYSYIPNCTDLVLPESLDYVHICDNNTIYGTQYKHLPKVGDVTLVSDMSSSILSKSIDVSKYGLIYAGSQKNMGPAGMTVVIIREDLITDNVLEGTPMVMRYANQSKNDSRYNTPPCYAIYMCGKMYKWLKCEGGLSTIEAKNNEKAKILYDYLDESKLFKGTAERESRSMTNITFTTGDGQMDMDVVEESKKYGFVSIKGHRFVGGLRASLYNAVTKKNVEVLVEYLKRYEKQAIKSGWRS